MLASLGSQADGEQPSAVNPLPLATPAALLPSAVRSRSFNHAFTSP